MTAAPNWSTGRLPRRRAAVARVSAVALLALALAIGVAPLAGADNSPAPNSGTASASAFDAQGMWIWYVTRSNGGSVSQIIARAHRSHIGTVYVKAGDGTTAWSQFTSSLVSALHAGGLKVCAWQFVYGSNPYKEAHIGADAKAKGADCLIIDAESQYEGKYTPASKYMGKLRALVGPDFPVSLAGFPYVDYHPAFPYSVFFGVGGAQYNQPQMYWKTIGTSVGNVYAHTYLYNRVFQKPIYPIGQTYEAPGLKMVKRFRRYAISYGATGVSWWSWQETSGGEWGVLGMRVGRIPGVQPSTALPLLKRGSKGDLVVWAQEHLIAAGQSQLGVDGIFKGQTYNAVLAFQQAKGLTADGAIGTGTWRKLLEYQPAKIVWGAGRMARASSALERSAAAGAPASASLPARRNEINPGPRP